MSTDNDAILCYGIDFKDVDPVRIIYDNLNLQDIGGIEEIGDDSLEQLLYLIEIVEQKRKIQPLPQWKYYSDFRRKLITECPVQIVNYCHYESLMFFVVVRGYYYSAYRGSAIEINPKDMEVPNKKIQKAKYWCEKYGLEWEDPKWLLNTING